MTMNLDVPRPSDFIEFERASVAQGIHQRIEEQVRRYPERVALKTPQRSYAYAEMNGLANSVAAEILSAAGSQLAQAAILLPHGSEAILSILGSMKAHKAYVPLDPKLPKQRLSAILEEVEPLVLITDADHLALAEEIAGGDTSIVNLSEIPLDRSAPDPGVACDPTDRAYILYTSGTTGRPKGIAFLHQNLLHHIMCMTNNLYFAPSDRVTWLHSASFSASVVDIYCCLTNGGALYPWDAKARGFTGLAKWLSGERITTFQWIPSAFRQFLRTVPEDFVFTDIRVVIMASEPLTTREVSLFRQHYPLGSRLVNQVGTSETYNYRLYSVDHHAHIDGPCVPAGYSVSPDREVLILGADREPLAIGSVGEIAVKSRYMSAGYWLDERLTETKFPRSPEDGVPMFLTGDEGKLDPEGCLMHLGRNDFQVKIRGFRVEPAEIDNALANVPEVADSITRAVENQVGEKQLVSYLLLNHAGNFDQAQVEKRLASILPEYMVPRKYVVLEAFPTLANGKVDFNRLVNPFEELKERVVLLASSASPVREEIGRMFAELLRTEPTSEMNFLGMGGDSLLTAILMHRVEQRFGVEVPLDRFLEGPTADHLTELVRAALKNGQASPPMKDEERDCRLAGVAPARSAAARSGLSLFPKLQANSCAPCPEEGARGRKNLVIIGAGQLGRETYTWASQAIASGANWRIKGFLDGRPDAFEGYRYDAPVLGRVESYEIEEDDVFVGAIGDPQKKVRCYSPIIEKGGCFVNLIHPLANIGRNVQLGVGIVAAPFSSVTCDVRVGNHVSLGALSNLGHDTVIGDWCHISSHCGINGCAELGDGVFLGSHVCIIPGIVVGPWAFVGAGSIVVRNVQPAVKVFGNPAAPIGNVGLSIANKAMNSVSASGARPYSRV